MGKAQRRAKGDTQGGRVNGDIAQTKRSLDTTKLRQEAIDDDPPRCATCNKLIPPPRRYVPNVKYCTDQCRERLYKRKARDRAKVLKATNHIQANARVGAYPADQTREGPVYETIKSNLTPQEWEDWVDRKITDTEIAGLPGIGVSVYAVGLARRAAHNNRVKKAHAQRFAPQKSHAQMLGPSDEHMRNLVDTDPDQFEVELASMVDSFVAWRDEFFRLNTNRPYATKEVHKRWIKATLRTIYTGGRQLVLSPPRHGKTELLIHFCEWLICRNPNIRILWVGPNVDIAMNCLGQVRDILESHEALKAAYLPPGETWAPARKGAGLWARDKFTVGNRTVYQKQPTMWATGVGGRILSLDADFIIVDDPADPDASYYPSGREKIANWFKVKLVSRKMMDTGLAMISSRVHPDDLYSELVEADNWEVLIDKAHDQSICGLTLWADHSGLADPQACILFPELNPLSYLREQATDVGEALFEMMYLNQPRPDGALIFDPDLIREHCLDISRTLGISQIGGEYRLVAGLDPAARATQAAFLWAVHIPEKTDDPRQKAEPTYYMVDSETQQGGGIEGAEKIIRSWYEKYGADLWIIEDNSFQKVIFDHPAIKATATELGVIIRPTSTGPNKHDPDFGVAGMAKLFHEGLINLPYGDTESVRKVDAYIRQLVNFTGDTASTAAGRKNKSDILMASWFPFATAIKKWLREAKHRKVVHRERISYPELDYPQTTTVPWGETKYFYD